MVNNENHTGSTNKYNSDKKPYYRNNNKISNGQANSDNNNNPRLTRELKFHMYDSSQNKIGE